MVSCYSIRSSRLQKFHKVVFLKISQNLLKNTYDEVSL